MGRRGVIGLGALGAAGALTACTGSDATPATPPPPDADELAVRRAAATAGLLRQGATTLAGTRPTQAALLRRIAAVHAAQLTALGRAPVTATTTTATPAPETLNRLLAAEWAGARAALRDGEAASDAAYALLLVRVAAARAADADLLARAIEKKVHGTLRPSAAASTPVPSTTASTTASTTPAATGSSAGTPVGVEQLDRLLAGQHAAVFAYPLVIARSSGARRDLARELWAEHRRERDELETAILSTGVAPTPARPAYDVGTPPGSGAQAAALAARVERGLTALAADVVAAATGGTRGLGADQLVLGARRTSEWTGRPPELLAEVGSSSPSPIST